MRKTRPQAHPELQDHELDREKKRMNSVLGENLDGLHQPEKQRSAPHSAQKCVPKTKKKSQLNSVLGEDLEDAGHHCAELEGQQSCSQSASTNCVQGESLEDLRKLHDHHAGLDCRRPARESAA